jgi:carbon storage regulator
VPAQLLREEPLLVLARKCGESIVIPEANIVITILEKKGDRIRIGIEAPSSVMVHRREVWERIRSQPGHELEVEPSSHSTAAASAVSS